MALLNKTFNIPYKTHKLHTINGLQEKIYSKKYVYFYLLHLLKKKLEIIMKKIEKKKN